MTKTESALKQHAKTNMMVAYSEEEMKSYKFKFV